MNWKKGDLESLLEECRSIQYHLDIDTHNTAAPSGRFARHFAKFMREGKLHAATHLIDDNVNSFPML